MEKLDLNDIYILGAPDDFEIYYGKSMIGWCHYEDTNAYPFIISNGEAHIGRGGVSHGVIFSDLLGMSTVEFNRRVDTATEKGDYDELIELNKLWRKASEMIGDDSDKINGRIYLSVAKMPTTPLDYVIFSFWNDDNKTIDGEVINQILRKFNVPQYKVLVACFDKGDEGHLIPLSEWDYYVPEADDVQKNAYALHLMNAHDKHDATTNFRVVRDNAIYTPRERAAGSMAAYHAMVHTENVKRIIRSVLKEYIYKETKKIIF
jgi:hypothetical protein